jgi:phosphate/sulfate permease
MFELETSYAILLVLCLVAVCAFEFVNGFHDTANAVATVIYTHTLKPWVAVIWSGFCNFLGVMTGGVGLAMGIVSLLPLESLVDSNIAHSVAMVASILLTAIFWNLGTWYLGIPCSSSHTLTGSILGVGLAFSFLPGSSINAVNWDKAKEMGQALLFSPLFGFTLAIILMYLIRLATKKTDTGEALFKEPKKNQPPPFWIRSILFLTCTMVSFFHGQNDGQKGVGLAMIVLIAIVPTYFAINSNLDTSKLPSSLANIEKVLSATDSTSLSKTARIKLLDAQTRVASLQTTFSLINSTQSIQKDQKFEVRKNIVSIDRNIKSLFKNEDIKWSDKERKALTIALKEIKQVTDYSPYWIVVMISLSLGVGTMIGWKRIVKTIGEKIGKEHLTYAQGATAEIIASITIGLASAYKLPVSTTHVLSSGIAGSMVASKGVKNLQPATVRSILIAWFLTLPVVMIMAGGLFLIFRATF